jgi:DNA-binding MarR family transcriptional regulator
MMLITDRMHRHLIDHQAAKIGIHRTQHRILMHIARNNKLGSQKSIAEHMGVSSAAITGALKKLEQDGYIERNHGSKDGRYNEVTITEKGKRIVEETRQLFSTADISLFDGFSDAELDSYMKNLTKIQDNIKKHMPKTCRKENENEVV